MKRFYFQSLVSRLAKRLDFFCKGNLIKHQTKKKPAAEMKSRKIVLFPVISGISHSDIFNNTKESKRKLWSSVKRSSSKSQ